MIQEGACGAVYPPLDIGLIRQRMTARQITWRG